MTRMGGARHDTGARGVGGRFDRRLVVLALVGVLCLSALLVQLLRLGVVEHARHVANVEKHLVQRRLLPASRGRILDRRGEVLAADRASWDVLLEYDAIVGRWATSMASRELQRELGRAAWLELSGSERVALVLEREEKFDTQMERLLDRLAEAGAITRVELDQRLDEILRRTARESKSRKEALIARELALYGEDARLSEIDRERVSAQLDAHVVLADVADEVAFYFQRLAEELPGTVVVEPSTKRWRPWAQISYEVDRDNFPPPIRSSKPVKVVVDGVGDHLLGSTRTQVFPEDLKRRPMVDPSTGAIADLGGYRADRDIVGASGIERSFEDALRGTRGVVSRDLEEGEESRVAPHDGGDVQLTVDIRLQSRLQALFEPETRLTQIQQYQRGYDPEGNPRGGPLPLGWNLDGAIVVLEIATGEVLAAVSSPTMAEGAAMTAEERAIEHPEVFRPTAATYPPGSILKPIVLCAAVAEGVARPSERIECRGHFFEDQPDAVRCWIYRRAEGKTATHGELDAAEALARSCNIYFYELARRLGPERLIGWFRRFGMGAEIAPDIAQQEGGSVPGDDELASFREKRDRVSPVLLGIGQGPLTWTPLHAAQAFATIARGGIAIAPRFVRDGRPPERTDLGIPRSAIDAALAGLRASVNETYGTGHHITLEGGTREELFDLDAIDVWGKTGTATAPKVRIGDTMVQTDHAWFVGLVGEEGAAPRYAIAVVLEHGGSGGKVAGPVAAATMRAIAAEGYLGDRAQRAAGGKS
ncbi:MAG: peptidoglycan D,D-transpeptidase FtsI family protein [bacterium]